MTTRRVVSSLVVTVATVVAMVGLNGSVTRAQPQRGRGGAPPAGPATPKSQAPAGTLLDFTGYWVSVVTEDWRYRMLTAPKGEHPGIPLTA